MQKMPVISASRRKACQSYNELLKNVAQVRTPNTDFSDVTPFLYYIRVPQDERDALRAFLSEKGVDSGIHWQPGHRFNLFKDCHRGPLPVTEKVGREILSLPLHSMMEQETVARVAAAIKEFFE